MSDQQKIYGIGAQFRTASELLKAAERVRDLGFRHWDVHTPFPIHGMDRAMGLGKSKLSSVVMCAGILGLVTGILLTTVPSFSIYPLIVHGKPYDWRTLPAFLAIMFELTVLFSALSAVGALLLFNRLPRWNHPVFNWEGFSRVTDDGFVLVVEAKDALFSVSRVSSMLEELGGQEIAFIHEDAVR